MSENLAAQTTGEQSASPRPFRRKLLRALIWLAAALAIYLLVCFVSGLIFITRWDYLLFSFLAWVAAPILLIYWAWKFVDRWEKRHPKSRYFSMFFALPVIVIPIGLWMGFGIPALRNLDFLFFDFGFQVRLERTVGLDKLSAWGEELVKNLPPSHTVEESIDIPIATYLPGDKAIPESIWQLKPISITACSFPEEKGVSIIWDGKYQDWKIILGSPPEDNIISNWWHRDWRKGILSYQKGNIPSDQL